MSSSSRFFALLMIAVVLLPSARGGEVYLDYTNFDVRMAELATSAGITPFTAGELSTLRSGIKSGLENSYRSFTGFSFTESQPTGSYATINFGLSAASGSLGVADHIDFMNLSPNDTARVFSGNFDFIVDEFSGSTNRSSQISQLTAALSGTAAHELGHNLGLRHHDAYGSLTFTGAPISTGGAQNQHIMATGSTGLSEAGRQTARDFSLNSVVKLAYAAGSLAVNPTSIAEAVDAGSTLASAFGLTLEDKLPTRILTDRRFAANRFAEVVVGSLASAADVDVYELFLPQNYDLSWTEITVDVNNDYPGGSTMSNANTFVELLDSMGNVIAADDVSVYNSTSFGTGSSGDGFDPALFRVPVNSGERYFVRVTSEANGAGDYQLLVHTDGMMTIPEPSSFAACSLGLAAVLIYRRRKQRQAAL